MFFHLLKNLQNPYIANVPRCYCLLFVFFLFFTILLFFCFVDVVFRTTYNIHICTDSVRIAFYILMFVSTVLCVCLCTIYNHIFHHVSSHTIISTAHHFKIIINLERETNHLHCDFSFFIYFFFYFYFLP